MAFKTTSGTVLLGPPSPSHSSTSQVCSRSVYRASSTALRTPLLPKKDTGAAAGLAAAAVN